MSATYIARSRLFDASPIKACSASNADAIERYRTLLNNGRDYLQDCFFAGASAQDTVASFSWLIDQVLSHAWQLHAGRLGDKRSAAGIALVAVGGYGREELHPGSDVDVLILVDTFKDNLKKEICESFIRFAWDIGLEVGHSVRTVKNCVAESKADITVATNLMESRLLFGDAGLFDAMQKATSSWRVWSTKRYFLAKKQEQQQRHERFDDTAYNLEPNLKDGPGGLRDIQMISWVTQRHFKSRSLSELVEQEFLSEEEHRTLIRSRNFLWRLRAGLHFIAGRREDRLLFDHQRTLAEKFGYEDRQTSLAVEQLMQRYYRTAKEIRLLNEILLQHFEEAIVSPARKRNERINRRFKSIEGYLEVSSNRVFHSYPFALLEIFHILQTNDTIRGIRANTVRQIRANLKLIDANFREDLRCRALFLEMIRHSDGLSRNLRRMNEYGVLGAYLPVFGRIVGQMQHDLFHVYTVDAHTLFVVRNARRFTLERYAEAHPEANEIMGRLYKRERLYLGALFHDIAKGRGGDHSTLGADEALRFCRHHQISEYDAQFIAWLVQNHLIMSWTAQHEDIADPEVVHRFAAKVGDQEHLDTLYLLTIADMRATGPKVWNNWKGRLLADLYAATTRALRVESSSSEELEERIDNRKQDAKQLLKSTDIGDDAINECWALFDDEYFLRQHADTIAWHTETIAGLSITGLPAVNARYRAEVGGDQVLVVAAETEYLLPKVTGSLDRLGLTIVDARFHRLSPGLILQSFVVLTPDGDAVDDEAALAKVAVAIRERLIRPDKPSQPGQRHLPRQLKAFPIKTQVRFIPDQNRQLSVLEVVAQDRPGLLNQIALALLDCKVRMVSARISTYGERAEDVFFLTDRDGAPLSDESHRDLVRNSILQALGDSTAAMAS